MFLQETSLEKSLLIHPSLECHFDPQCIVTLCEFTVTIMSISDSTDSGGQMSCDKVVTNVF